MITKLVASQFVRFMTTGRTFPALLGCENGSGATAGEFVVKLRGTMGQVGRIKDSQNILNKMPGNKDFVRESEAEDFAEELAREVLKHS
jgi:hypothetical protein